MQGTGIQRCNTPAYLHLSRSSSLCVKLQQCRDLWLQPSQTGSNSSKQLLQGTGMQRCNTPAYLSSSCMACSPKSHRGLCLDRA